MKKILSILLLTITMLALLVAGCSCNEGDDYAVTLNKSTITIEELASEQLTATKQGEHEGEITWSSSDANVASVQDGLVFALNAGQAVITATWGDAKAECQVTVNPSEDIPYIQLNDEDEITLLKGGELSISPTVVFRNQTIEEAITFTSEDATIATVENNVIKAISAGTVKITATASYMGRPASKVFTVIVKPDVFVSLEDNALDGMKTNAKIDGEENVIRSLSPKLMKEGSEIIGATFEFKSSDENVVTTTNEGVLTAVSAGNATIEITAKKDGEIMATDSFDITVEKSAKSFYYEEVEVYATLASGETTPVSNDLLIDCSKYWVDANYKVFLINGSKETEIATENYSLDAGKISIDSAKVFGSTLYGDLAIKVVSDNTEYYRPLNVITKKLYNRTDFENMVHYGGIDTTTKVYGGYFVLADNIDMGGNAFNIGTSETGNKAENGYEYMFDRWSSPKYRKENGTMVETPSSTETGFTGLFDGRGYEIKNCSFSYGRSGLFGYVYKTATVKNVGISGTIWAILGRPTYVFGKTFLGSLENSFVSLSPLGTETNCDVWLIAQYTEGANFKDVLIKYDGSTTVDNTERHSEVGLAEQFADLRTKNWTLNNPTCDNLIIVASLGDENAKLSIETAYGDSYLNTVFGEIGTPSVEGTTNEIVGIKWYPYDAVFSIPSLNSSYWNQEGDQPVWQLNKPQIKEQLSGVFEVYSGLEAGVPVANVFEFDFQAIPMGITLKGEGGSKALTTSDYTFDEGKITIDGSVFGADIYGNVEILVDMGDVVYNFNKTVVTKYITNKTDLMNMQTYGGVHEYKPAYNLTTYKYGGYFVLTNDIDCGSDFGYGQSTIQYSSGIYQIDAIDTGFTGIFNGGNYKLRFTGDFYSQAKASNNGTSACGIFGNVSQEGTVKNVAIVFEGTAGFFNAGAGYTGIFGYSFAGTLENVEISIRSEQGSSHRAYTGIIAHYIPLAKLKNVVIKADNTTISETTVCLLGERNKYAHGGKDNFGLTCENVVIFANGAYVLVRNESGDGDNYNITSYAGVTVNDYATTLAELPAGFDSSVWALNTNGQPTLKANA